MPMHDWTQVEACIFNAFHHGWISAIGDALNVGLLTVDYYALAEAETDTEFNRRKKSAIAIRHVSDDRLVAMIEILSPGNKSGRNAFRAFVDKAWKLLEHRIHLLLVDPFPPGPRDPNGVHAAIWAEVQDDSFVLPPDKQLTLAAYECDVVTRAYIEPIAVGDVLPDMPLFLEPNGCVQVPLEATYQTAFAVMPRRWRDELQPPADE
jgi:hypothetical protein